LHLAHHGLLLARVVEEDAVAGPHGTQVLPGEGVADAVPHGPPVAHQVGEGVAPGFLLEQPQRHAAAPSFLPRRPAFPVRTRPPTQTDATAVPEGRHAAGRDRRLAALDRPLRLTLSVFRNNPRSYPGPAFPARLSRALPPRAARLTSHAAGQSVCAAREGPA